MSEVINCYRLYCETEEQWKECWGVETPTKCPTDTAHTINAESVHISHAHTVSQVSIKPNYGDDATVIDGLAAAFSEGEWKRADLMLVEALAIQQVHVIYTGFKPGDYGRLSVTHPVNANGYSNPTTALDIDDTVVSVDPATAAVAAQACALEFWSEDDSELLEVRGIQSVNGNDITLVEGVSNAHSTSARLRVVMMCFSPRGAGGADHITSGFYAVGAQHMVFGSEAEATDPVSAGLQLAHRFKACATAGTREVAVSYRFRRPSA